MRIRNVLLSVFVPLLGGLAVTALGLLPVSHLLAAPAATSYFPAGPTATGIRETGGPTDLTVSSIADGELLYRTGSTIDGLAQSTFLKLAGVAGGQTVLGDSGAGSLGVAMLTLKGNTGSGYSLRFLGTSGVPQVVQSTDDTTSAANLQFISAATTIGILTATGANYTPSGALKASVFRVAGFGAGGLSLAATDSTGDVRVYGGGTADADLVATFADDQSTTLTGQLNVISQGFSQATIVGGIVGTKIQTQTAATRTMVALMPNSATAGGAAGYADLLIYNTSDVTKEYLNIGYYDGGSSFYIGTQANTGTLRPLLIDAAGGTTQFKLNTNGTTTFGGVVLGPNGSASAPAWSFTNSTNSGVYYDSALRFAFNGASRMYVDSGGLTVADTAINLSAGVHIKPSATSFIDNGVTAGITASATETQGQQPLVSEINEVSTAGANDVVTAPAAVAGRRFCVFNNSANTIQLFPASGDNVGGGVDTAVTLATTKNRCYQAFDATTYEDLGGN